MSGGGSQYGSAQRNTGGAWQPYQPSNQNQTYQNASNYAMNRMGMMPSFSSQGYTPGQYGQSASQGPQRWSLPDGSSGFIPRQPPTFQFPNIPRTSGIIGAGINNPPTIHGPTEPPPQTPTPDMPSLDPNSGTGDYMSQGGSAPYTGGAQSMNKPAMEPQQFSGRTDIAPSPFQPLRQNYNSIANFQMPGQIQQPRDMVSQPASAGYVGQSMSQPAQQTPTQWAAQNASLLRPQTVMDPAYGPKASTTPTMPPMPQGPQQPGQHDYYWGPSPMGSAYSGQPFGWNAQFGGGPKQYMVSQLAGGQAPWANQVNWNDAINSIGQLSGTPYNPSIYGAY